jgi:large exoprotein involved in heme utilization and adhesion
LTLRNGALITTSTTGMGHAGTVTVVAKDSITMASRQDPASILSNTTGAGEAGRVALTTPLLTLEGNALIATRTLGDGNAGNVEIQVGQLTLTEGAQIGSTSGIGTPEGMLVVGKGRGGTVIITATEAISIAGRDSTGVMPSGVFTQTGGVGEAVQVTITTPHLTMTNRGSLGADTGGDGHAGDVVVQIGRLDLSSGAQISSESGIFVGELLFVGAGAGGTVAVTATDAVTITGQDSGLSTSTRGVGRGGDVTLQAQGLTLTDGARLAAESTGLGNAGNVTVTTQAPFLLTNGSVVTRATHADGGNIQITTPTMLRLRDSTITAEVGGGASTVGGNITIDPQFVLLQNSQIVANAFAGRGGNISIAAQQVFLADPASQVSASSALGINGQVDIRAPVTNISGTVAPLPQAFAPATELLRNRCAERLREGTVSRLVVGGRDGVPLEPGSVLLSPLERGGQEGEGQGGKRERQPPEAQPGGAGYAQAQAPGGLDGECARWRGKQGPTGTQKRTR